MDPLPARHFGSSRPYPRSLTRRGSCASGPWTQARPGPVWSTLRGFPEPAYPSPPQIRAGAGCQPRSHTVPYRSSELIHLGAVLERQFVVHHAAGSAAFGRRKRPPRRQHQAAELLLLLVHHAEQLRQCYLRQAAGEVIIIARSGEDHRFHDDRFVRSCDRGRAPFGGESSRRSASRHIRREMDREGRSCRRLYRTSARWTSRGEVGPPDRARQPLLPPRDETLHRNRFGWARAVRSGVARGSFFAGSHHEGVDEADIHTGDRTRAGVAWSHAKQACTLLVSVGTRAVEPSRCGLSQARPFWPWPERSPRPAWDRSSSVHPCRIEGTRTIIST